MTTPKGVRLGGRKKGTPNKRTARTIQAIESAGITPLEYMLQVLRRPIPGDATLKDRIAIEAERLEAAKAAAPYVHPKLATTDVNLRGKVTFEQLLAQLDE